jgi:hypothetical protein
MKNKKKLVLNEDTVRQLTEEEANAVAGGVCPEGGNTSLGGCGPKFSLTTQGTCTKSFCGGICNSGYGDLIDVGAY